MPAEDVNRRKERVMSEAKKVVDNINEMSFLNLDDHQVHSLMMMREIARGIVNNKVSKVTKGDVKKALSSSIEKMVGSCKDVNNILSRIPCEGMDDEQTHSVSRMKEIVSTIVSRRSKILGIRNRELLESGNSDIIESKMPLPINLLDADAEFGGIQRRLFEDGQSYGQQDILMLEAGDSVNGNVPVGDGLNLVVAADESQVAPTEGLMFEDVELMVEEDEKHEEEEAIIANETSQASKEEGAQNEAKKLPLVSPFRISIVWPRDGTITQDWVVDMMAKLDQSSKRDPPSEFSSLMSSDVVERLIGAATSVVSKEPNCVEVDCRGDGARVVVVGDVEGHFHDLLNIFTLAGLPSENQFYVFNGNYVDRGAWGLEVFLVLLAWKILMPSRVYLLRGNHETRHCTTMYGFEQEVKTKFGDQGEAVYQKCLECFKELPLASVIAKTVYTTHGGLFRNDGPLRRSKRKRSQYLDLGSLEDLSKVKRTLVDVPGGGPSVLADVLWSDPSKEEGLIDNSDKRMGLAWGPDCTETFLQESGLKLIIRSHQGPDARAGQEDFGDLLNGYSEDHVVESGKLYTLFSAPDYPQFGEPKYNNEGAYAVLKAPDFENPSFHSFKGVRRPQLAAYGSSSSQTTYPTGMSSKVDFEALGILNPPSWSVTVPDITGGTKDVEIPRAHSVEGLPLSSEFQEPHKAVFEYLFEMIAGLKHMISSRVIENEAPEAVVEGSVPNENEVQIDVSEMDTQNIPDDENEGKNVPEEMEVDNGEERHDATNVDGEKNILKETEAEQIPEETEAEQIPEETEAEQIPEESEAEKIPEETEAEKIPEETEEEKIPEETEGESVIGEMEAKETPADEKERERVMVETEEEKTLEEKKETISSEKEEPKIPNEEGERKTADENEGMENPKENRDKTVVVVVDGDKENEEGEVDSKLEE